MAPQFTLKQWVLSHLIGFALFGLAVLPCYSIVTAHLTVTVLDVGQGDAILIQTPEAKNILVDAGPDSKVIDGLGRHLGFFDHTIDLFVLTHPHRDHFVGLFEIIRKYDVKKVMLTGVAANDLLYKNLLRELKTQGIGLIFPESDHDWMIGRGIYLDILYPFAGQPLLGRKVKDLNDTSIVMRLTEAGRSSRCVLLMGDAQMDLERAIIKKGYDIQCDILKVGHHGSKTATSDALLKSVDPKTAVISAGKDNKFGHPHAETLAKLKNISVHKTMDEGDVVFRF